MQLWLSLPMQCHVFLFQRQSVKLLNPVNIKFGGVMGTMINDQLGGLRQYAKKERWGMGFVISKNLIFPLLSNKFGESFKSEQFLGDTPKIPLLFQGFFPFHKMQKQLLLGLDSVFKGRDLLVKGFCWRVGNGNDINIWKDPWVLNKEKFLLCPNSQDLSQVHKVLQLIDLVSREQNLESITHLISLEVVEGILRIPLPHSNLCDKLIWFPNKKTFSR